jgi:hypothetical protein
VGQLCHRKPQEPHLRLSLAELSQESVSMCAASRGHASPQARQELALFFWQLAGGRTPFLVLLEAGVLLPRHLINLSLQPGLNCSRAFSAIKIYKKGDTASKQANP